MLLSRCYDGATTNTTAGTLTLNVAGSQDPQQSNVERMMS